jgi:hypothetical protein
MDEENERYHKKALELLAECEKGNHKLVEIHRALHDPIGDVDAVVRWCEICGAIVIDVEFDNRTQPGRIMKMKGPTVTNELVFLLRSKKKEKS